MGLFLAPIVPTLGDTTWSLFQKTAGFDSLGLGCGRHMYEALSVQGSRSNTDLAGRRSQQHTHPLGNLPFSSSDGFFRSIHGSQFDPDLRHPSTAVDTSTKHETVRDLGCLKLSSSLQSVRKQVCSTRLSIRFQISVQRFFYFPRSPYSHGPQGSRVPNNLPRFTDSRQKWEAIKNRSGRGSTAA